MTSDLQDMPDDHAIRLANENLRTALARLVAVSNMSEDDICHVSHHGGSDCHGLNDPCPVARRYLDAIAEARKVLPEAGT